MASPAEIVFWSLFFTIIVVSIPAALVPAVLHLKYEITSFWLCGVILLPMTLIFFVVHLPIVLIFCFHKEFCKNRTFKIMSILGALECFQLLTLSFEFLQLIIYPRTILKGMAASYYRLVGTLSWDATINITFILAYNRFATIVLDSYPVFNSSILYYIGFVITVLIAIMMAVLYTIIIVPIFSGQDPPISTDFLNYLDVAINWTAFAGTAICYISLIVFMMAKIRKDVKIRREWSLTVQAFIFSVFFAFATTTFDLLDEEVIGEFMMMYGCNTVWIFVDVSNVVIYLSFNKRLREAYITFWRTASFVENPNRVFILVANPSSM